MTNSVYLLSEVIGLAKKPTEERKMSREELDRIAEKPLSKEAEEYIDFYAPIDDPERVAERVAELNRKFGVKG